MYRQLVDWWNMKIHTIKHDTSLKQGYHSKGIHPAVKEKGYIAGLCEDNRGYSVAFSGSGASKKMSEAAAKVFNILKKDAAPVIDDYSFEKNEWRLADDFVKKIIKQKTIENSKYGEYGQYPKYKENMNQTFWGKIVGSERLQKIGEYFDSKPSVGQAFTSLLIAGMLRPATNIAMAGKDDKEDSIYAASHAIASAVIGYIVSATVLAPFDASFKRITMRPNVHLKGKEDLLHISTIGPRRIATAPRWAKISQICKMSFDTFILGIPKAMLTIALIPPILKYVFGIEKKSKKAQVVNVDNFGQRFFDKQVFTAFKGGVK